MIILRVTVELCRLRNKFFKFPKEGGSLLWTQNNDFMQQLNFPEEVVAIGGNNRSINIPNLAQGTLALG